MPSKASGADKDNFCQNMLEIIKNLGKKHESFAYPKGNFNLLILVINLQNHYFCYRNVLLINLHFVYSFSPCIKHVPLYVW